MIEGKLFSGEPYWLKKDIIPGYPGLTNDTHTDVLVIGAGITGALMTYYLTEAGLDCVVIDSGIPGMGSTCASTSLLQYESDVELITLAEIYSEKDAVRIYKSCAEAVDKLVQLGNKMGKNTVTEKRSLYYASDNKIVSRLHTEFTSRKKHGFQCEWMERNDIRKHYGLNSPAAILSAHSAETDALKLSGLLFKYAESKGARVFQNTSCKKIKHNKKNVTIETGSKHTITAKKMVWCTGFASQDYINKNIVNLDSTYVIISEPVNNKEPWNENTLIWETARPYLYIRTTEDNRIIIGGRDDPYKNAFRRERRLKKRASQLESDFKKLFPHVEFKTEYAWAGTFGRTNDGLPFIGTYPKKSNSYFACGFGGNGITYSVIAAEIILDLVRGKKNSDLRLFDFNRKPHRK